MGSGTEVFGKQFRCLPIVRYLNRSDTWGQPAHCHHGSPQSTVGKYGGLLVILLLEKMIICLQDHDGK